MINHKLYYPLAISGGIEKSFIVNLDYYYYNNYICSICQNFILDPVESTSGNCRHVFCRVCIKKWLNINKTCPLCKVTIKEIQKSYSTYKALGKFIIKCLNKGCQQKKYYEDIANHLENCPYRLYHCSNNNCNYVGLEREVESHSKICGYRIIRCHQCQKLIVAKNKNTHLNNYCENQTIECPLCHIKILRRDFYRNHYSENNRNVNCLKNQQKNFEEKNKELNNRNKELLKRINNLDINILKLEKEKKNQRIKYENQIASLENRISKMKGFFKNLQTSMNVLEDEEQSELNAPLNINKYLEYSEKTYYSRQPSNARIRENYSLSNLSFDNNKKYNEYTRRNTKKLEREKKTDGYFSDFSEIKVYSTTNNFYKKKGF